MSEDTVLPATEQAEVNVRITHASLKDKPYVGFVENTEIHSLPHVYSARSLLPAKFLDIKIAVLNVGRRRQVIPKGTEIGVLQKAEEIHGAPEMMVQTIQSLSLIHI